MRKTTITALLLFFILSLIFTYPLPLHLAGAVEDTQDALLNVWITAWDGHQLLDDPLHLFDANIFYPYPRTLAYSELLLGNALLALPLTAATGNPILGYNVALLLSFLLSGLGAYLLALKLSRSPAAGLLAGAIFAFSSYRLTNLAQAQLLTTQWLPFALLALHNLLRRPRPRHAATFVLFFCLQALSSFYYAILLALAAAAYWAFDLIAGLWRQRAAGRPYPWANLRYLALSALGIALVVLPFALPYFRVQRELGFERTLADNEPFSASLRQYALVPPGSLLHGLWLPSDDTPLAGGYPVDALFPGLAALALAAWGLLRGRGRSRWFFLLLALAAGLLSLGPRLYLAPGQPAGLDARLPYTWLYALVPGFKALRAPVRFYALTSLSLAVLAAYGLAAVLAAGRASHRKWLPTAGLLLLVCLESLVWPAARAEPLATGGDLPAVYRWLAGQPAAPILELPMAFTPSGPRLEYQYFSTYHWHTTPDGYSGFIPPKHGQVVYEMERFPSERALRLLQALDVAYVVVHAERYPADQWPALEEALARSGDLAPVETFGRDLVYRLTPHTFDPAGLQVYAYLPPRARAGAPYTAYVVALNPGPDSYTLQPTAQIRPAAAWTGSENPAPVQVPADPPLVTSGGGGAAVIPLALTAPAAPGSYQLSLAEPEGPLGGWASSGAVQVGDEGDDAFPVPARLSGWHLPATARPGGDLVIDLAWAALGKIDAYYSIYVKLLNGQGQALIGWDGQPRDGEAPTLLWRPGETISDTVTLALPTDLPPGEYAVVAGMYRAEDLARCLTLDAEGRPIPEINLGTIQIQPE